MSVRAYRVNRIDYEEDDSFNLWHDIEFMVFVNQQENIPDYISNEGGLISISIETLKEAVKKIQGGKIVSGELPDNKKYKKYFIDKLLADISSAEKRGDYYVQYYCF
ncbi:MAG: hypothetical protein VKN72_04805 [Nostocales cyanobacterium 94392]|nr:hypothetical protein [Nostocales cyanobacterium 94392]